MTIKPLLLLSFIVSACIENNSIAQGTLFSQLDPLTQEKYLKIIKTKKYDKDNDDFNWTLFLKDNNGTYDFVGFGDVLIGDANRQNHDSIKKLQDIEKAINEDDIVLCSCYGYNTIICNTKDSSSCEAAKEIAIPSHQLRKEIALEHDLWDSAHKANNRNPLTKVFHRIFGR